MVLSCGAALHHTRVALAAEVPVREFGATGPDRLTIHDSLLLADRHARYAVVFTDGDTKPDWLLAGEALSAVLLSAAADGLATSPMSDLVKVPASRALLRDMLAGRGYPAVVVRIGVPAKGGPPLGTAPRRAPDDVIDLT